MEGTGLPDDHKRVLTGDDIASEQYLPPTCTAMYRHEVLADRPAALNSWWAGDKATALWAAYYHGTIDWVEGILPSVYRVHEGGVWSGADVLTRRIMVYATTQQAICFFPVSRQTIHFIRQKRKKEVFWFWRKWHGSEVPEERQKVRALVRQEVSAWPPLRWWLLRKQLGYWLEQWRLVAWHGVVLGVKRILPRGLYQWGHRVLKGKGE